MPGHPVQPAFREVSLSPPGAVAPVTPVSSVAVILPGGIKARCADAVTAAALIKALREER